MSLREKQMMERRNRILDAAELLIRQTGGTDFSVRKLASTAEVAPATPFNLFSSKEGLFYDLLSRNLDWIISEGLKFTDGNRLFHIVQATTNAVDMFVGDPAFLRPLYRVLLSVDDKTHRPRFMERSIGFWKQAVATIPDQKLLSSQAQRDYLAMAVQAQFIGLLEFWVHEELDDPAFRKHAVYGIISNVIGLLDEDSHQDMMPLLQGIVDGTAAFDLVAKTPTKARRKASGARS